MDTTPATNRPLGRFRSAARDTLLIAALVFVAALIGSLSRPVGFLAAFWPANALLAGLMVRNARFRTLPVLMGATAGYIVAALVVGDDIWSGVLLTAANLAGVLTFAGLFGALDGEDRGLSRPQGVISLLLVSGAAAAAAGVVGGLASEDLTGVDYFDGWLAWFAAELVNYLALLPVVLTVPTWAMWKTEQTERLAQLRSGSLSLLGLVVAVFLTFVIPYPLAIFIPVSALVWCALVLPMSSTTILVMLYSGLAMMGIKLGLFDRAMGGNLSGEAITSVHLAVGIVALVPVVVASVVSERRRRAEQVTS